MCIPFLVAVGSPVAGDPEDHFPHFLHSPYPTEIARPCCRSSTPSSDPFNPSSCTLASHLSLWTPWAFVLGGRNDVRGRQRGYLESRAEAQVFITRKTKRQYRIELAIVDPVRAKELRVLFSGCEGVDARGEGGGPENFQRSQAIQDADLSEAWETEMDTVRKHGHGCG
jgi:hypothetical protein